MKRAQLAVLVLGLVAIFAAPFALGPPRPAHADIAQGFGTVNAVQCSNVAPTLIATHLTNSRVNAAIQNLGPNDIYFGFSTGLTTANGWLVPKGSTSLAIDLGVNVSIYCLAVSALQVTPADTRFMELK